MKSRVPLLRILAAPLLLTFSSCSHPASADDPAMHIGEDATAKGRVLVVFDSASGNTFLDFGGSRRNEIFTGVLIEPAAVANPITNPERFEKKRIAATGRIQFYRGQPVITISDESQIKTIL